MAHRWHFQGFNANYHRLHWPRRLEQFSIHSHIGKHSRFVQLQTNFIRTGHAISLPFGCIEWLRPWRIWRGKHLIAGCQLFKQMKRIPLSLLRCNCSVLRSKPVCLVSLAHHLQLKYQNHQKVPICRGSPHHRYKAKFSNIQCIWRSNHRTIKRNRRQRNWHSSASIAVRTTNAPCQTHRWPHLTSTTHQNRQSFSVLLLAMTKAMDRLHKSGGYKVNRKQNRFRVEANRYSW